MIGPKSLQIRFDKLGGFIRVYDGTRHLVLFGPEKYDAIYNTTRYLISQKSGITYVFSNNHAKIKIDSYNSCYNINIKLVFNNYQNHYYYIFRKMFVSTRWKIMTRLFW